MTSLANLLLPTSTAKPQITRETQDDVRAAKDTKLKPKIDETEHAEKDLKHESEDVNFLTWINALIPTDQTPIKTLDLNMSSSTTLKPLNDSALLLANTNTPQQNLTAVPVTTGTPASPTNQTPITTNLNGSVEQTINTDPSLILNAPLNEVPETVSAELLKNFADTLTALDPTKTPVQKEQLVTTAMPAQNQTALNLAPTIMVTANATPAAKAIDVRLNKIHEINLYTAPDDVYGDTADMPETTTARTTNNLEGETINPQTKPSNTPLQSTSFDVSNNSGISLSLTNHNGLNTLSNTSTLTPTSLLTNPVINNTAAVQSHAATQSVAAIIQKNIKEGITGSQSITMRLDPAELGRMDIRMEYKKGDPLKVHLVVEKEDTMNMFMRDKHTLETALNNAGVKTENLSLSFEHNHNAFDQAMNSHDNHKNSGTPNASSRAAIANDNPEIVETKLDMIINERTGRTHYNMLV